MAGLERTAPLPRFYQGIWIGQFGVPATREVDHEQSESGDGGSYRGERMMVVIPGVTHVPINFVR
jgi:hypothetical protein